MNEVRTEPVVPCPICGREYNELLIPGEMGKPNRYAIELRFRGTCCPKCAQVKAQLEGWSKVAAAVDDLRRTIQVRIPTTKNWL